MSDDSPAPRPRPQYGEYAPPGWTPPSQPAPAPEPAAPPPAAVARRWDRPLTSALLAAGFVGMAFGVYAGLNLRLVMEQAALIQGTTLDLPVWTDSAGIAIAVSHVVLYAIALAGSLGRLRRGEAAFWVPLAAGAVAAFVYHGTTLWLALASGLVAAIQP